MATVAIVPALHYGAQICRDPLAIRPSGSGGIGDRAELHTSTDRQKHEAIYRSGVAREHRWMTPMALARSLPGWPDRWPGTNRLNQQDRNDRDGLSPPPADGRSSSSRSWLCISFFRKQATSSHAQKRQIIISRSRRALYSVGKSMGSLWKLVCVFHEHIADSGNDSSTDSELEPTTNPMSGTGRSVEKDSMNSACVAKRSPHCLWEVQSISINHALTIHVGVWSLIRSFMGQAFVFHSWWVNCQTLVGTRGEGSINLMFSRTIYHLRSKAIFAVCQSSIFSAKIDRSEKKM